MKSAPLWLFFLSETKHVFASTFFSEKAFSLISQTQAIPARL